MDKRKCINGHYFNLEKYDVCPICGGEAAEPGQTVGSNKAVQVHYGPLKPTEPLYKKNNNEKDIFNINKENPVLEESVVIKEEIPEKNNSKKKWRHIFKLEPTQKHVEPDIPAYPEPDLSEPAEVKEEEIPDLRGTEAEKFSDIHSDPEPDTEEEQSQVSLAGAVARTGAGKISALPKTQARYEIEEHIPPVGWLVCIAGTYKGRAFECRAGKNRIGRNPGLEINLTEELTVNREAQAVLIYEPNQRTFLIQDGTGDGLVYLNDALIMTFGELHSYDQITLGKAKFVFVPLCGERFTWDEYLNVD